MIGSMRQSAEEPPLPPESLFTTAGAFELLLVGFGAVITLTLAIVFYFVFLRPALAEERDADQSDQPSS